MTISLKQVDIGHHIWSHGNHESKTYNRYTKTREKGTHKRTTKENHQTTSEETKRRRTTKTTGTQVTKWQ